VSPTAQNVSLAIYYIFILRSSPLLPVDMHYEVTLAIHIKDKLKTLKIITAFYSFFTFMRHIAN